MIVCHTITSYGSPPLLSPPLSMLSLRLLLEGAKGLFMLRLLQELLPSLLLCLDIFWRDLDLDLDAEMPLD